MLGRKGVFVLIATVMFWSSVQCWAEGKGKRDARAVLQEFCMDCHDRSAAEGDFVLPLEASSWNQPDAVKSLELVHTMIEKKIMPPVDMDQPSEADRRVVLDWLDKTLIDNSPLGGTPLRRLSGREYANTVSQIFGLTDYSLPAGFPPDNQQHGFDNQGEALVIAASHLESMADAATQIADQFFPPPRKTVSIKTFDVPAKDLVISYSSACLIDGAMRLASSGTNVNRHATWPTKFEAPVSGRYRIEITASSFDPRNASKPVPALLVEATQMTGDEAKQSSLRIKPGPKQTFEFEIGLDAGATIRMRYANGPFDYEDKAAYTKFLETLLVQEPEIAAAWKKLRSPARGGSGWERLKEVMASKDLDVPPLQPGSDALKQAVKSVSSNAVSSGETLVYKFFEEGPFIAIERLRITGPMAQYQDRDQQRLARKREQFVGELADRFDQAALQRFLAKFLRSTFRRAPTQAEIDRYTKLVQREHQKTGSLDDGLHLAVRTALISPAFLYRSIGPGQLSDHELASRLSYFLTSAPPDETLLKLAESGRLSSSGELEKQTRRLLKNSNTFAEDFTSQWLGLDAVDRLMPDARLIRLFSNDHRQGMRKEVVMTFQHVLDRNQSVTQLIAPDFVFTNEAVGREIYDLPSFKATAKKGKQKTSKAMKQVAVDPEGRVGGLLSMPAIMMATANGVDTQPVLRGVWLLENILGSPPPEPPKAVPALTPDTAGATSPKARLAAHMAEPSCAACHREIDPLGFVLENFDPIGRWRETYPVYTEQDGKSKRADGLPIDATGTLPSGEDLRDVTDLKKYLVAKPTRFAGCLSEKLMTYATGRSLNYRERQIVSGIVVAAGENDLKFADLIVELVDSEVFRTK
ncbi:hypothetical protein SV7mr_51540 [Stieleria bergensis]|uniref:Planctomycete cytochrome C n=1 Tax=Stieleria bergensis TaxID=2528025 RepID=A0A517T2J2_9BACT|nr:hypothetical protein SV7mr_51540 [Planctomycetes bacterium SV_7m_r]